jgi:diphosphomevalonate decarboxylase
MRTSETYKLDASLLAGLSPTKESGRVSWRCPSNIALIKYWGKRAIQLPENPSLSFTLREAVTETSVEFHPAENGQGRLSFTYDGKENESFAERIRSYTDSLVSYLPFLSRFDLYINSKNTFPHSSGIASSAAAMGALALCFTSMEQALFGTLKDSGDFYRKASFLARLGSGSAARSVYGGFVLWGVHEEQAGSSDEYGVPVEIDEANLFWSLEDAILITSREKKKVSSSAGHGTMVEHPYAQARYAQARRNLTAINKAISKQDELNFVRILEEEALSLHAMMLSADPGYTLLNDQTWAIIRKIREFRKKTGTFATFTLDAGPNVHFIFKKQDSKSILAFIENELVSLCDEGYWIHDGIGKGPERLSKKQEVGAW